MSKSYLELRKEAEEKGALGNADLAVRGIILKIDGHILETEGALNTEKQKLNALEIADPSEYNPKAIIKAQDEVFSLEKGLKKLQDLKSARFPEAK